MIKISIVTVSFNSAKTIASTLRSVAEQDYPFIEHIVVDGGSTDGTGAIVREFPHVAHFVSEPDEGIYDGMNKGVELASGDIVGILNSDDFYPHQSVLSLVATAFTEEYDSLIGDIVFVSESNLAKQVRVYSAKGWRPEKFAKGFMPPHPGFFVRRKHYLDLGLYQTDYKICADYELLIRFLHTNRLSYRYLPEVLVHMRTGGVSNNSIKSRWLLNKEVVRACRSNGLSTSMARLSLKYLKKIFEYRFIW